MAFKNNYIKVKHKEAGTLIKNKFFKLKNVNIYGKKKIKTLNRCTIITVANGIGKIISSSNIEIRKRMKLLNKYEQYIEKDYIRKGYQPIITRKIVKEKNKSYCTIIKK